MEIEGIRRAAAAIALLQRAGAEIILDADHATHRRKASTISGAQ